MAYRRAQRARLVLLAAGGGSDQVIADQLGLSRSTVYRWRIRFSIERLAGLEERPGRGRPPRYTEDDYDRVISTVCTDVPTEGATHRMVRSLAQRTGVSQTVVHRILRAERLAPHRVKSWVIGIDPEFETKALDRTQPSVPLCSGKVERRSFEYKRNGTTSLHAALAVHQGEVVGQCALRHRHQEFLDLLRLLARTYPRHELHLIVDNLSSHKHEAVQRWLDRHPWVQLDFTPTHASWLNQVELWFSIVSGKVIRRGIFTSAKVLVQAIMNFIEWYNQKGKPFAWTFTPERLKSVAITGTKH